MHMQRAAWYMKSVMGMELEAEVARYIKRIARKLKLERTALSAGMSGMRGH